MLFIDMHTQCLPSRDSCRLYCRCNTRQAYVRALNGIHPLQRASDQPREILKIRTVLRLRSTAIFSRSQNISKKHQLLPSIHNLTRTLLQKSRPILRLQSSTYISYNLTKLLLPGTFLPHSSPPHTSLLPTQRPLQPLNLRVQRTLTILQPLDGLTTRARCFLSRRISHILRLITRTLQTTADALGSRFGCIGCRTRYVGRGG